MNTLRRDVNLFLGALGNPVASQIGARRPQAANTKGLAPEVRRIRHERGLSIEALAKLVGVGRSTIVSAEQGRRLRYHTAAKIAEALGIDLASLNLTGNQPSQGRTSC